MAVSDRVTEIQAFLQQATIFERLSSEQLKALANIAILQTYKRGETIFLEGDENTGLFIVKSGRIKVFKLASNGKEQILHIFGADEYFAEVPTFDGGGFPASAAAIEASEVVFIPRVSFLTVLQQYPSLAIAMLATLSRHLRQLTHLVDSLSFKEVPERLATYLLRLSQRQGETDTAQLDLSKGQLAALLGTIPETLSRAFYKLSQEGIIEIDGANIRWSDRQKLVNLSNKNSGKIGDR